MPCTTPNTLAKPMTFGSIFDFAISAGLRVAIAEMSGII
jgi:hypothetical protein